MVAYDCTPLPPETIPCSSHGICDNVTRSCMCFTGFSSLADLTPEVGVDCDQNSRAIQALGTLCCILGGTALVLHSRVLFLRYNYGRNIMDSLVLCPLIFACYSICVFLYGVIKSENPLSTLGRDLLTTVAGCSASFFFTVGCALLLNISGNFFSRMQGKFSDARSQRLVQIFQLHKKALSLTIPLTFLGTFWPLFVLKFPNAGLPEARKIFALTLFCVWLKYLVVYIVGLREIRRIISVQIDAKLTDEIDMFQSIYRKMTIAFVIATFVCPVVLGVAFAVAFWPELGRMTAYVLLVAHSLGQLCCVAWVLTSAPRDTIPGWAWSLFPTIAGRLSDMRIVPIELTSTKYGQSVGSTVRNATPHTIRPGPRFHSPVALDEVRAFSAISEMEKLGPIIDDEELEFDSSIA